MAAGAATYRTEEKPKFLISFGQDCSMGRQLTAQRLTHLRVRKAAHISMAPQKETSPSPWLKCMSPILKLAPSTKTGKYTCHAAQHVCFAAGATHAM